MRLGKPLIFFTMHSYEPVFAGHSYHTKCFCFDAAKYVKVYNDGATHIEVFGLIANIGCFLFVFLIRSSLIPVVNRR